MKKLNIFVIFTLILLFTIGFSSAHYKVEDFHEMNGTIIDKEVSGKAIDYLIDVNGTICYLSCDDQPFEEFSIGDNVTMNGTIDKDYEESLFSSDFDGKYDGKVYPHLVLMNVVVNQHTYGQMRLTDDVDNQYYKQVNVYNP